MSYKTKERLTYILIVLFAIVVAFLIQRYMNSVWYLEFAILFFVSFVPLGSAVILATILENIADNKKRKRDSAYNGNKRLERIGVLNFDVSKLNLEYWAQKETVAQILLEEERQANIGSVLGLITSKNKAIACQQKELEELQVVLCKYGVEEVEKGES